MNERGKEWEVELEEKGEASVLIEGNSGCEKQEK